MDAFDGSGLPLESRTPSGLPHFQWARNHWTSPLSVDRLTLPQIYGQISPRLMRPPCLRAKNARFPARFARKPGVTNCKLAPMINSDNSARSALAAQMVQNPEGRNHQRNRVEGNQCLGRIDECEDPEDQVAGLRLSQSSTLPQRDHVSPGRT